MYCYGVVKRTVNTWHVCFIWVYTQNLFHLVVYLEIFLKACCLVQGISLNLLGV